MREVVKSFKDEMSGDGLWGDRFHKTAAKYLEGKGALPDGFEQYQGYLDAIKAIAGDMHVELQLALDAQLNPCDFFRGTDIFMRAVIDVHISKLKSSGLNDRPQDGEAEA